MSTKRQKEKAEIQRQDELIKQKMLLLAQDRSKRWEAQESKISEFYQLVLQYTKSSVRAAKFRDEFKTLFLRGGSTQVLVDRRRALQGGKFSSK